MTSNGKENIIYNGVPDLLYEEFIFKSNKAFWWHEDGNRLAYASIDNSKVQRMSIVMYGSPPNLPISPPQPVSSLTTSTKKTSSDVRSLTKTTNTTILSSSSPSSTPFNSSTISAGINKATINSNHHPHHYSNQLNTNNFNNHLYSNGHSGSHLSTAATANAESIYPKIVSYPYPKPGQTNPTIHIHIVDLQSNVITRNHKQITPPRELTKMYELI